MKEGIPRTQRAWQQIARGKPKDVLRLVTDAPIPRLGPDDVLVKVHSAALNPGVGRMMGSIPWPIIQFPSIPEIDFAGRIADANGHSEWEVGQEVLGYLDPFKKLRTGQGALAEYLKISSTLLVSKPTTIPWSEAAGLPIAGLTAYEGIVKRGHVAPGQRIFVNGGSSAIGAMAVQIAKGRGAVVVTTCSGAKREFVEGLGADLVLDYTASPLVDQLAKLEPFDLVLDCIGIIPLYLGSAKFLKPNCPYLMIGLDLHGQSTFQSIQSLFRLFGGATLPVILGGIGRKLGTYSMKWDEQALKELVRMVEMGEIRVPIDGVYGWGKDDMMKAYERQMSSRAQGKIIVQMEREE